MYGSKSSTGYDGTEIHHRTTSAPSGEEDQTLCNDPKVDAMFSSAEGHPYVFKGINNPSFIDKYIFTGIIITLRLILL